MKNASVVAQADNADIITNTATALLSSILILFLALKFWLVTITIYICTHMTSHMEIVLR